MNNFLAFYQLFLDSSMYRKHNFISVLSTKMWKKKPQIGYKIEEIFITTLAPQKKTKTRICYHHQKLRFNAGLGI